MDKYSLKLYNLFYSELKKFQNRFEDISDFDYCEIYDNKKKAVVTAAQQTVELDNGLIFGFSLDRAGLNHHFEHENLEEGLIYSILSIIEIDPFYNDQKKLGNIKIRSRNITSSAN